MLDLSTPIDANVFPISFKSMLWSVFGKYPTARLTTATGARYARYLFISGITYADQSLLFAPDTKIAQADVFNATMDMSLTLTLVFVVEVKIHALDMINKIDVSIVSAGIISSMESVENTLIIVYVSISEVTVFPAHLGHS